MLGKIAVLTEVLNLIRDNILVTKECEGCLYAYTNRGLQRCSFFYQNSMYIGLELFYTKEQYNKIFNSDEKIPENFIEKTYDIYEKVINIILSELAEISCKDNHLARYLANLKKDIDDLESNLMIMRSSEDYHLTLIPEKDRKLFINYVRENGRLSFIDAVATAYGDNKTSITFEDRKVEISKLGYLKTEKPLNLYDYKRFTWTV